MLNTQEINVIGDILNTTWGKFSTDRGSFPLGTAPAASLTGHLVTEVRDDDESDISLVIKYVDIVTFRSDQEAQASVKVFRQIAEKRAAAKIAEMKETFKASAGRSLKIKLKQDQDSVETIYTPTPATSLIGMPANRPQIFRGYYRYTGVYKIA